ncbi:hypothetical protein QQ045_032280 [Rhodiola kirilowii]
MNEAKSMAHRRYSSSNYSMSSVESSGTSSRFSPSVLSEDGEPMEPWSPPRRVEQGGGVPKPETWPSLRKARSGQSQSELEMMKERFSRLLLGEDMSGSGKGVCTALAISNGITNLYASIFGDLGRLEALPIEKKEMWRREMNWFLSVGDHIVEMVPSYKTFPNGTQLEIMTCKQRSDLFMNLPALRKLDSMLMELLDGFRDTEFWYVDHGKIDTDGPVSFEKVLERQREKWWLPVPRVPKYGLPIDSKMQLHRKRECAIQIFKAAMLINTDAISDMEVPDSYLETLPKTGKACLGDRFYKLIASDNFSIESVFGCLDLSADDIVSELVNRLEAAINLWHTKSQSNLVQATQYSTPKSSSAEADRRRELFSARAEELLFTLKHQFPHLPQTTLEITKIQCNKDAGKAILESYSRVLESLAYNIVTRIDDLLTINMQADPEDRLSLSSGIITPMTPKHRSFSGPCSTPLTRSPSGNDLPTHSLPPTTPDHSYSKSEIVPSKKPARRRNRLAKRVLANYLCVDTRGRQHLSSKDDSVLAISSPRAVSKS